MAAAAMATAASAAAPPHRRPRARILRRGISVRCAAVAGGAAEAPASTGARLSADCVVVGGGVSGLCTAQALATRHGVEDVLVTEARTRPGGNITTVERPDEGYLWEEGPNSFQPSDPVLTMAVDSGLKDDLVFGDPNAPRFVLWEGKLRPVPSKPADLPFFDLMSIPGKLRAGLGALGIRPPPPGREESVEEFVRRNLGTEVFERLIEPFCSGVYAGDLRLGRCGVWKKLEVVLLVELSRPFRRGARIPNHRGMPAFQRQRGRRLHLLRKVSPCSQMPSHPAWVVKSNYHGNSRALQNQMARDTFWSMKRQKGLFQCRLKVLS